MKKIITIFILAICQIFFVQNALAKKMLVNSSVLAEILEKIDYKEKVVPEYDYYNDIKVIRDITDMPGYSSAVKTEIRAEMFPNTSRTSVDVYKLPAVIYFPDNPEKNPIKLQMRTVDVLKDVKQEVLDTKEVKLEFNAMNGKKSPWIVYGQTVLKNTTTTLAYDKNNFLLESTIDISNMSKRKAKKYFFSYAVKITELNRVLDQANNVEGAKYYKKREKEIAKLRKKLNKETHTNITAPFTFQLLSHYSVNNGSLVKKNIRSELGHWSFEDPDASNKENVNVEVLNHGTYYEALYLVPYDDNLDSDDNKDRLAEMIAKMNEKIQGKLPKGAQKTEVKASPYYGFLAVISTFSIEQGVKGKTMYKNNNAYPKFIKKTYKSMKKVAKKYRIKK